MIINKHADISKRDTSNLPLSADDPSLTPCDGLLEVFQHLCSPKEILIVIIRTIHKSRRNKQFLRIQKKVQNKRNRGLNRLEENYEHVDHFFSEGHFYK
nr:hypothetical protein [Dinophyceae sp. MRD-151]